MTATDRKDLKKYLRKGDISKIATAVGITPTNVSAWLNGNSENSICEPFIIQLVETRKEELAKRIKEFNGSTNN